MLNTLESLPESFAKLLQEQKWSSGPKHEGFWNSLSSQGLFQLRAVASQGLFPARGCFPVSSKDFVPAHGFFQAGGSSSQKVSPVRACCFFIEGCSNPELVPARGLFQEGFCSSHGLVPAKGVSPRFRQVHAQKAAV